MAKKESKQVNITYLAIVGILILVAIGFAYLYTQKSGAYSQETALFNSLNSNYTARATQLRTQISTLQTQLTENETLVSNITNRYTQAENNLTHPYTEILYNEQTINLPRYNESNYTYNSALGLYYYNVTWGRANYSFDAPYPGYLVLNGTSTVINNPSPSTCAWEVFVSNKLGSRNVSQTYTGNNNGYIYEYAYRYHGADELFVNLTSSPWTELCPIQSTTYDIPVAKGENHLIIDNYNSSGITVTFSAKYVGFHTS